LKRFTPDGRKILTSVDFPTDLDLHGHFAGEATNPQYQRYQSRYQLVGVVRHKEYGTYKHYTSCALIRTRETPTTTKQSWYEFDDRKARWISYSDACRTGSEPYLLFYQQTSPTPTETTGSTSSTLFTTTGSTLSSTTTGYH